jgi:hypothetical protein
MRLHTSLLATVIATASFAVPTRAQQQPPIRPLGAVVAKTAQPLPSVNSVRQLPGNRVMVNDVTGRRVLLFDSTLANVTVVADSTSATSSAYSGRIGGLIPYRADSTLFVDPMSMSMLVIDPAGKITRVMSVPRSQDAMMLGGPMSANAAFDATGRLVYRGGLMFTRPPLGANGAFVPPQPPESTAIVRVDLATRQVDTLGYVKIPKINMNVTRDDKGFVSVSMIANPLPVVDEWAVLSDGSVAFVRGRDYHVDWVNPDGSKSSSPKIPFEWQRLSDEDKVAFLDSVKAVRQRLAAEAQAKSQASSQPAGRDGRAGAPPAGGPGEARIMIAGGAAGGPPNVNIGGPGGAGAPNLNFVSPSDLPDYKPPFFAGAVRADGDDNLWIRTIPTRAIPGGPVYDVVNRKGELVDRVQVPADRTIIGFGPGGVVYLTSRDSTGVTLERARAR